MGLISSFPLKTSKALSLRAIGFWKKCPSSTGFWCINNIFIAFIEIEEWTARQEKEKITGFELLYGKACMSLLGTATPNVRITVRIKMASSLNMPCVSAEPREKGKEAALMEMEVASRMSHTGWKQDSRRDAQQMNGMVLIEWHQMMKSKALTSYGKGVRERAFLL